MKNFDSDRHMTGLDLKSVIGFIRPNLNRFNSEGMDQDKRVNLIFQMARKSQKGIKSTYFAYKYVGSSLS